MTTSSQLEILRHIPVRVFQLRHDERKMSLGGLMVMRDNDFSVQLAQFLTNRTVNEVLSFLMSRSEKHMTTFQSLAVDIGLLRDVPVHLFLFERSTAEALLHEIGEMVSQ
jgi:hypothetical protein